MADAARPTPQATLVPARRTWSLPLLHELPKLTDLTLASAIGGGGGTGGGGSTVFGILLALTALTGCAPETSLEPGAPEMPRAVAAVNCTGRVSTKEINCSTPQASPGMEILSGQGFEVALRSSNVSYDPGFDELTFDVSLQNLSVQRLGWDGATPTGAMVFFPSAPIADVGTIQVMNAGQGFFTAPNQDYYLYIGILDPLETSATVTWHLHFSGGGDQFSFQVLVAADVFDQGGVLQWKPVDGTTKRPYNDVVASSPTDRMAVGNGGLSAHYTGGKWLPLPRVITERFTAVTAIAPGEYFATTESGRVLQFKNKVWTVIYDRGDNGSLEAIWAKDASQIVAVGFGGITSRYSGGVWTDQTLPTGNFIAVSGTSDGSLVSALTEQGAVWTSAGGGGFGADPNFAPIVGLAKDIVYDGAGNALMAYLDVSGGPVGFIVSSTGDVLFTQPSIFPLQLIPRGTDALVFGYFDFFGGGEYRVGDLDYSIVPGSFLPLTGTVPSSLDLADLTATDAGATTFAATTNNGSLYRFGGSFWSDEQGDAESWTEPDLWGAGDTLWALDGLGLFYKLVDGVISPLTGHAGIYLFWGSSPTSFFAITATDVWHSNGSGSWTHEFTVPGGSDNRDIWADPTGTAVIALGENGHIASRISGVWSDQTIPRNVNAVWGCDAHTAWIVTQEGEIWKWLDGVVTLDVAVGPNPLRAIAGNQFCDPWVVGDNGTAYHRLGGAWTDRTPPGLSGWTLRSVVIRGAGQAIAVGDDGNGVLISDASPFSIIPIPALQKSLISSWRLNNGEVYLGGEHLLLRGVR